MDLSEMHFTHPLWLLALLTVPLIWIAYFLLNPSHFNHRQLDQFVDKHLLPYLLLGNSKKQSSLWKHLLLWTAVWSFLSLALAGPRWTFRESETFSKDQNLVILLDLSDSMNATDIKPSRLARAKQKIEDILNLAKGVKIGLIAFAADSFMITPLTDDIATVLHLLPTLDTDLVYVQGSRLSPALEMASNIFGAEQGSNNFLLLISDGGFEDDANAIVTAKKLGEKGIVVHTMGIGTIEGIPLNDKEGNILKKDGVPVISRLDKDHLSEISKIGNGRYIDLHYSNDEERAILNDLNQRAEAQTLLGKKNRVWDEYFYLLILPVLPIILLWFRRGYIFAIFLMFVLPASDIHAEIYDYFKNNDQLGKDALEKEEYETAINAFEDPYRKGISYYRAGDYEHAEQTFRQSKREDVTCHALYNLGNSLVYQQKLQEAITTYEEVLKKWPDHTKAKENLEIVKKMLEQQPPQDQDQNQDEDKSDQNDQKQKDQKDNTSSQDKSDNQKEQNDNKEDQKDNKNEKNSENNENNEDALNEDQEKQNHDKNEQNNDDKNHNQNEQNELDKKQNTSPSQDNKLSDKKAKSDDDLEADLLLNRINSDPKDFMKNKFYIESKKNGTKEGLDPW